MRQAAVEKVGVAGRQCSNLFADRYLESPAQYDAAFLRIVAQHRLTGVGTRLVGLVEYLQLVIAQVAADLTVRDRPTADLAELRFREEVLHGTAPVGRKEIGKRNAHGIQHAFQQAHRRIGAAALDQRYGRVGHITSAS